MLASNFKIKKFIIFAGSYSEDSGGTVVLHKLCDLLNQNGYEAYLYPAFKTTIIHQESWFKPVMSILYGAFKSRFLRPFKTLSELNTPTYNHPSISIGDDCVVIYAEGVAGNPLKAKNVVRWLLHKPGYNYKGVFFGNSELIFSYSPEYSIGFSLPLSKLSNTRLFIPYAHLHHYTGDNSSTELKRSGLAYCIRKGKGKPFVHDDKDAILIDGLSHAEVADIFKKVKTLISYDSKTAYSIFAAVSGVESIIIPDPGVSIDDWCSKEHRYGLSYGFDNLEWARDTLPQLLEMLDKDTQNINSTIHAFVSEVNDYFSVSANN